jgi:maltodextrin utilization protein YvdJ
MRQDLTISFKDYCRRLDLLPFFEIIVMILVGFIDKKWFKYNKAMLTLTVLYSGAYLLLNLIIIYLPVCFLLFVL